MFICCIWGFHLAHRAFDTPVGSWAAVELSGTRLPSNFNPPRLGTVLPLPRWALRRNYLTR